MANPIQIKRGLKTNLPVLLAGQPGFTTDTKELFIGDGAANHQVVMWEEFTANTILAATVTGTPAPITVAEERIIGRASGGDIADLTAAQILTILGVEASADVTDETNVAAALAAMASFQLDSSNSGPKLKNSSGVLQVRNAADDDYGDLAAENLVVNGNLTVSGTTTTVNTEEMTVDDNIIVLNNNVTGTPTENSGIEIERGTETNAQILWDESADVFKAGIAGALVSISLADSTHAGIHIKGGAAEIDGDQLDIDFTPTNYTPSTDPSEVTDLDHLSAHLKGIDVALASVGATGTFLTLTDTPSSYTALSVLRANAAGDAVEMVGFAATYLEGTPTEDESGKAPTSEWAFDHAAATTGVHGAGSNTLLHSASTIDGGTF